MAICAKLGFVMAPAITIHDLDQARAAATAANVLNSPLCLVSPPGAAGYLGVGWLPALLAELRALHPDLPIESVLDCAGDAGAVMAAIRQRAADAFVFTGSPETADRLTEIAEAAGLRLLRQRPDNLELAAGAESETSCREWLERSARLTRPGR
jgi:DNA-binding transcriptional LysR family regulator